MRYAVYFCPAVGSALDGFGCEWLATTAIPGVAPERLHALLADVRRYGWHATLAAPFTLTPESSYDNLRQKLADIARQFVPFALPLKLDSLASFLALRPSGDESVIHALSESCVRQLNTLRAPLTETAWQRRAEGLDETELNLFRQFGYPYVLERYRFHMTLSAPISETEGKALHAWLSSKLAGMQHSTPSLRRTPWPSDLSAITSTKSELPRGGKSPIFDTSNPLVACIDALTLCRENEPGMHIELLERFPLSKGVVA